MSNPSTPSYAGPRPAHAWNSASKMSQTVLQNNLDTAIKSAFNPHPTAYSKVIAVLLHFDNDDIGVTALENELAETFQKFYGFSVKQILLLSKKNPQMQLFGILSGLETNNYTGQGCLVILVYSGHSESVPPAQNDRHFNLILGGAVNPTTGGLLGNMLDWYSTQLASKSWECDVLQVMDCCFAAEAVTADAEVLAATSTVDIAAADVTTCFTKALITELRRASCEITSVATLHAEMMRNRQALKLQYSPIITERRGRPSIILQKLGGGHRRHLQPKIAPDGPRILLTAHLEEPISKNDCEAIKKWLLSQVPTVVTGMQVTLEGAWKTQSSLLLFSVPIEVWTQIADHSAWSFVAVVNSTNGLLNTANPSQGVLSSRPMAGSENVRPGLSSK